MQKCKGHYLRVLKFCMGVNSNKKSILGGNYWRNPTAPSVGDFLVQLFKTKNAQNCSQQCRYTEVQISLGVNFQQSLLYFPVVTTTTRTRRTRRATPPKFSQKGLCQGFEILRVALSYQKNNIVPLKRFSGIRFHSDNPGH